MNITDVTELAGAIKELRSKGNLLYPVSYIDSIPPMHKVSVRVIRIDANPDMGQVYHPQQTPRGRWALTKIGLIALDSAAGLDWVPQLCKRVDDGKDQFYCVFTANARIQDLDGSFRTISAEYTLDYRDGSIMLEGLKAGDIKARRMTIAVRAETAAKNRVRRDAIGIKPTYSEDELKKPFYVLKLVKDIPARYNDAMAAAMLGVDQKLFGANLREDTIDPGDDFPDPAEEMNIEDDKAHDMLVKNILDLYKKKMRKDHENPRSLNSLSLGQLREVYEALLDMEK